MEKLKPTILRVVLPLATLGAFYAALILFSVGKARVYRQPRPALTAKQSQAVLLKSRKLLADGKYREALGSSLLLTEAYPANHVYLEQVAQIYEHLKDYEAAAGYWEKYMKYAPVPETACPQIGNDYWKQGEAGEPKAIAAFERCLKLDPTDPDFVFYLAHGLEMSGDYARAAREYRRGIKMSPQYVDMRVGLARVMVREGKYAEAQAAGQKILAKSPNDVDALLVMGLSYMLQGQLDQAKGYFAKGVQLSPDYTDFHLELAHIAEKQNDYPEAIKQYTEVVRLQPGNQVIRTALANLKKETQH